MVPRKKLISVVFLYPRNNFKVTDTISDILGFLSQIVNNCCMCPRSFQQLSRVAIAFTILQSTDVLVSRGEVSLPPDKQFRPRCWLPGSCKLKLNLFVEALFPKNTKQKTKQTEQSKTVCLFFGHFDKKTLFSH